MKIELDFRSMSEKPRIVGVYLVIVDNDIDPPYFRSAMFGYFNGVKAPPCWAANNISDFKGWAETPDLESIIDELK